MARVFVSYRKQDSSDITHRIYDHLVSALGKENVFMDVDAIDPGSESMAVIEHHLASCDTMLVVIGPRWSGPGGLFRPTRIKSANDMVRYEVATALARGIRVIPLLLGATKAPERFQLPPNVKALLSRQYYRLHTNEYFHIDMDKLLRVIRTEPLTTSQNTNTAVTSNSAIGMGTAPSRKVSWPSLMLLVVGTFGLIAFLFFAMVDSKRRSDQLESIEMHPAQRGAGSPSIGLDTPTTVNRHVENMVVEPKAVPTVKPSKENEKVVETKLGRFHIIHVDRLFGVKNMNGHVIIAPQFENIEHLPSLDLFAADDGSATCIYDTQGKLVLPCDSYDKLSFIESGMSDRYWPIVFASTSSGSNSSGRSCLFDLRTGSEVRCMVEPMETFATEGLLPIRLEGKMGYMNEQCEVSIPAKYDDVRLFNTGVAPVRNSAGWGLISKSGQTLIPCQFEEVGPISCGRLPVMKYGRWGFVNLQGVQVIPLKYAEVTRFDEVECVAFARLTTSDEDGTSSLYNWGLIDQNGKALSDHRFRANVHPIRGWTGYSNGECVVSINDDGERHVVIDRNGKILRDP